MSEPNERKRKPNFSDEELVAMIMAVHDKKEKLLSKLDSNITGKTKQVAWTYVTEAVNNVSSGGVIREVQEVRKKFADFRGIVKKKAAANQKCSGGTGGGPEKPVQYTAAEKAMLPLIKGTAILGLNVSESIEGTAILGLNVPESLEPAASFHGSAVPETMRKWKHMEGYKMLVGRERRQNKTGPKRYRKLVHDAAMDFILDSIKADQISPNLSRQVFQPDTIEDAPPESPPPISCKQSMYSSDHSQNLMKAVADTFSNARYSDTTIACEGLLFPAHKMVLAASSEYFNEIFTLLPEKSSVIVLKDISSDILNDLLKFIYCGEVDIEQTKVNDFLNAANSLKVVGIPPVNLCPNDTDSVPDEREQCESNKYISSDGNILESVLAKKARRHEDNVALQRGECGRKRKISSSDCTQESVPSKKAYTLSDDVGSIPTAKLTSNKYQPQVAETIPKTEISSVIHDESEAQENCNDKETLANVVEECWIKEEIDIVDHHLETEEEIPWLSTQTSVSEEEKVSASLVSATVGDGKTTSLMIQPKNIVNEFSNVAMDGNIVKKRVVLLGKKFVLPKSYSTKSPTDGESSSTQNIDASKSNASSTFPHGFEYDIIDKISKNQLLLLSKAHLRLMKDHGGNMLCPICKSKLRDMQHFKRHLECHTLSKMFRCRHGDFSTFSYEHALKHGATHNTPSS